MFVRPAHSFRSSTLIDRIKNACARNGSGVVTMFFDEAQRSGENEYAWLRDVHDHLDRINIRLFTFLIGQEELHTVKSALQQARKTQIVARLMVASAFFAQSELDRRLK